MSDTVVPGEALNRLRTLHIRSDRDNEVASHIQRLFERDGSGDLTTAARTFTKTGETRGFMLIGSPGSGKSHLVARTLSKLDVLAEGDFGRPRYVHCSVPSPATLKSVITALLKETGYPEVSERRAVWSLVQDLKHRLMLLGISVIWLDEAHDLFCADRSLILRALKSLMQGEDAVVVLLSGTEELADVIRSDPQVKRRFTAMVLPQLVEQVDGENFMEIVTEYCGRVGLGAPTKADLIARLFHASRYLFGRAIELLLHALEMALEDGAQDLTIDHFAGAYAMEEACDASDNIFYADTYWLIDPDAADDGYLGKNQRGKRG